MPDTIVVKGQGGLPYSKGVMARALMAGGLAADQAYELARRVERELLEGDHSFDFDRVQQLAVEQLGEEAGGRAVRRLRRVRELQQLDEPVIMLIGGATGTGKSTVATEIAYRLGITRVTSTDFVRQTMRAFFSQDFMPAIHYSSFEAGASQDEDDDDRVLHGFLAQTRNVLVGVRAAIERVMQEGWSMVLEGVHLVPGMVSAEIEGALVVQFVLAIDDVEAHASHFWLRDSASGSARPFERYLDSLGDIREIQDYIVGRAEKAGVPVIENGNIELAIAQAMELVLETLAATQQAADASPR